MGVGADLQGVNPVIAAELDDSPAELLHEVDEVVAQRVENDRLEVVVDEDTSPQRHLDSVGLPRPDLPADCFRVA